MSFSESLKSRVRKRAHVRCCVCHSFGVEVHHIVPESEGGPDTEENAAPLCPSCHEIWGSNSQERNLVRDARDVWLEICATTHSRERVLGFSGTPTNTPGGSDLARVGVQNAARLSADSEDVDELEIARYSFVRPEFIHPLIVRELGGGLADVSETVLAVDLLAGNRSSRFYGDFSAETRDGRVWVTYRAPDESFTYAHIAKSASGVEMVECYNWTGGSGVFGAVTLFAVEADRALGGDLGSTISTRLRIVLKTLGSIPIGDRYDGTIIYHDGILDIGPDVGWFRRGREAAKSILIR